MADWVKENIRQTSGGGGGGGAVTISDGTASGGATVQPTTTTTPAATDNPLLVRSIIGDESNIVDLFEFAADDYDQQEWSPGARHMQMTLSMLAGPSEAGNNTDIRVASVLDGLLQEESANDNQLLVRQANRTDTVNLDGAASSIGATTAVTVAGANGTRRFLTIKNNSGSDMTMALGRAAGANDTELKDGESFTMDAAAIYTGLVSVYNPTGGALDVHVIEF